MTEKHTRNTGYMELATYADMVKWMSIVKWMGILLVLGGLQQLATENHPQRDLWEYAVSAALLVATLVQIAVLARLRRRHDTYPSPFPLVLHEFLILGTCALGSAFCGWVGFWSLVCCFCGISVICGISHFTRAGQGQSYRLLLPLFDSAENTTRNGHDASPMWVYLVITADGIDLRPFHQRPGNPGDADPLCRVLVEYRGNQLCLLTWSEGVNIDGDPDSVEALIENVAAEDAGSTPGTHTEEE